jgi:hypothetical protein
MFASAGMISSMIAICTIGFLVIKAAISNPGKEPENRIIIF